MQSECFALFHCNLAFSALPEADRPTVIQACYTPLLDLVEQGFPLGIELGGWSLAVIHALVPAWVERFRALLADGRCSLIGSGYQQIIGPLVPARVNRWNQELGLQLYEELLGTRPRLALVNEMAFAASNVSLYAELGYQGLVLARENAMAGPLPQRGPWLVGQAPAHLPVLFGDALLFQKFQRLIHGDIEADEYWSFLERWQALDQAAPIYCSDAEIFGYRPRRYAYEQVADSQEWARIGALLREVATRCRIVAPEQALVREPTERAAICALTSCAHPITVKKQPKYHVGRWAVSGRDDLYLNTLCHKLAAQLGDQADPAARAQLCRLFASDLRTHIGPARFEAALTELERLAGPENQDPLLSLAVPAGPLPAQVRRRGQHLLIDGARLQVSLNLRRGLAIDHAVFDGRPLIGTVAHGFFDHISLGADFYSGGTVVEVPGRLLRVTDLERVEVAATVVDDQVVLRCELETALGPILKTLAVHLTAPRLRIAYAFPGWQRPLGSVRLGQITLLPEAWTRPFRLHCHQGGERPESFPVDRASLHQAAVSGLISSSGGLGATTGTLRLEDGSQFLELSWDPRQCAAFPMLWHQPCPPAHLTRLLFSLAELDDTHREGGRLLPLALTLSGGTLASGH